MVLLVFSSVLGGGTSPTKDDYKLENMIEFSDGGLQVVSSSCDRILDDDTLYIHQRIIKNNSDSPITINESGMISSLYPNETNNTCYFLWARETFDSITIQPGEVRSFVMTIKI